MLPFSKRHSSRHQIPRLAVAALTILNLFTCVSATNLTEQYQLCKTDAEIEALQRTRDLIRVDAKPTHGALQPAWPETLITIVTSIYSIAAFSSKSRASAMPLLIQVSAWIASFIVAEVNYETAGWISCNLASSVNLVITAVAAGEGAISVLAILLGFFQFIASYVIIGERFAKPTITYGSTTLNLTRLGSVAYKITDFHGCVPWNKSTAYREKGARSDAFRTIQTVQANYSVVVLLILFVMACSGDNKHEDFMPVFPFSTLLISFPLLVYEAVVASKGRPIVMSGDCMLVELDPRFGFLDSKIDNWWKALVGITGL